MGAVDGDQDEVFEIVDFTTASEWEVFTAGVEEALRSWRLCGDRPNLASSQQCNLGSCQWKELKQIINYHDFPFELSYHSAILDRPSSPNEEPAAGCEDDEVEDEKDDMWLPSSLESINDYDNSFPSRAHCVARWYGLREFIIASPAGSSCSVAPSKARLILSSLTMAATNTNCQVGVLVQVLRPADRMFLGTLTAPGLRANLDMIHLRMQAPVDCYDYDGLVRLMSAKVQQDLYHLEPVASIRYTYMLSEWPEEACWTQAPPDLDLDLGAVGDLGYSGLSRLPFGLLYDPVRELQLSAVWPRLPNGTFEDSITRYTLDPCRAPIWTAKLLPQPGSSDGPQVAGLLGEHLVEFLAVCADQRTVPQLLGAAFQHDEVASEWVEFSSALDRLTEHSVPSLGSVIMGKRRRRRADASPSDKTQRGPLSQEILVPILNFLFPEDPDDTRGEEEHLGTAYPSTLTRVPSWPEGVEGLPEEHPLKEVSAALKSVPAGGLVWRVAVVSCHVLQSLGGLPALAHLLHEIRLELRFRWDNCLPVPGVDATAAPDLASSLLHQKLQMLNCCIAHRAARDGAPLTSAKTEEDQPPDEADEFFDCMTDEEDDQEGADNSDQDKSGDLPGLSSWDRPEGRLKQCGRLKLLVSGARLFVPQTQDPAPVTEDTLHEQAEVLLRLGDTDEGSALRARLLSSSLLSDMEAFKAANPGCQLADFVRWYSPRDWVEVKEGGESPLPEGEGGSATHRLSDRMTLPGNLWQEVWQNAHPVPARRQKRLFDEAKEAERALQWLGELGPGELCRQLLPVVLHVAACRLAEEPVLYTLPSDAVWGSNSAVAPAGVGELQHGGGALSVLLGVVLQRLGRLSRQPCDPPKYNEVIEQLIAIEKCIGRALSLRHKLLPNGNSSISQHCIDEDTKLHHQQQRRGSSSSTTATDGGNSVPSHASNDTAVLLQLISSLLCSGEVAVDGAANGVAGQALLRLFDRALQYQERVGSLPHYSLEHRSSLPPSARRSLAECTRTKLGYAGAREYIVRAKAEYPRADSSRAMPHRLYATFIKGDFRVAGLFTQDTTFT